MVKTSGGSILLAVLFCVEGALAGANEPEEPAGEGLPHEIETIAVVEESSAPEPAATILEDIIVTATKREEFLRDITGSVAAFTGSALEQSGAREQEDFLRLVPGVSLFKEEPNRSRITIRGIAADNGTSQAAGILIGDVPFTDPFIADLSPDLSPFDLETVEVLKGPQGTLFGASGLAGAIRYVLRPAELDQWQARGFVGAFNVAHGERTPAYGIAINAPIHDRLALRVVGTVAHRPGVIDETGRDEPDVDRSRQESVRALVRFVPTDRFDVRAVHLKQATSTADLGFVDEPSGDLSRDSTPTASPIKSDFSLDQLSLDYHFDWAKVTSVTGHVTKFLDVSADISRVTPGTRQFARATVDGYTQELRLASSDAGAANWQWLAGAFFMRYDTFRRVDLFSDTGTTIGMPLPQVPFIPGTTGLSGGDTGLVARFDLDATARELALFGEVTRALGAKFDATVGLRAYRTSSVGVATASGPLSAALTGQQQARNNADLREEGLSPKAALKYRWTDDVLVYGLASRGFRFGGIQLIGDTPAEDIPRTYKSDQVWLYEAGLRTDWLRRTLAVDVTLYRMDWSDPQITQLNESGTLLYIDNVGASRVLGGEAALKYLTPLEGLSLGTRGAYTDARTAEPFTASSGTEIPVGTRWPFTADRQFAADATYVLDVGAWSVSPSVVYSYTGRGFSNIENTVPIFGYSTVDARVRVGTEALPGMPSLELSGTNLLDRRGVASNVLSGDVHTIYYIRPFTVSAQVSLRF